MRKNSVKNTRINSEVQKVLAETIRGEIKDPRIAPLTSVVAVEVSPDLKTCKAWISVLGDEAAQKETMAGLKMCIRDSLRRINTLKKAWVKKWNFGFISPGISRRNLRVS